ncbi:hypothetical protein KM043_005957 [Ampulex compressa]|nr:hypothetical protein KM043_005957 [Ampulex compressa]
MRKNFTREPANPRERYGSASWRFSVVRDSVRGAWKSTAVPLPRAFRSSSLARRRGASCTSREREGTIPKGRSESNLRETDLGILRVPAARSSVIDEDAGPVRESRSRAKEPLDPDDPSSIEGTVLFSTRAVLVGAPGEQNPRRPRGFDQGIKMDTSPTLSLGGSRARAALLTTSGTGTGSTDRRVVFLASQPSVGHETKTWPHHWSPHTRGTPSEVFLFNPWENLHSYSPCRMKVVTGQLQKFQSQNYLCTLESAAHPGAALCFCRYPPDKPGKISFAKVLCVAHSPCRGFNINHGPSTTSNAKWIALSDERGV